MSRDILYVNDTLQTITANITKPDGSPQDMTGISVSFALREEYATTNTFGPNTGNVDNAATAAVSYTCSPTDLRNITPGVFRGSWILQDNSGNILHVDAGQFGIRSNL